MGYGNNGNNVYKNHKYGKGYGNGGNSKGYGKGGKNYQEATTAPVMAIPEQLLDFLNANAAQFISNAVKLLENIDCILVVDTQQTYNVIDKRTEEETRICDL